MEERIYVVYIGARGVIHIPCQHISIAKLKADSLHSSGKLNVKVIRSKEKIEYIPGV